MRPDYAGADESGGEPEAPSFTPLVSRAPKSPPCGDDDEYDSDTSVDYTCDLSYSAYHLPSCDDGWLSVINAIPRAGVTEGGAEGGEEGGGGPGWGSRPARQGFGMVEGEVIDLTLEDDDDGGIGGDVQVWCKKPRRGPGPEDEVIEID